MDNRLKGSTYSRERN
jgi:NAD(P)-dependent dehydrogenase (short-subunit alcohol dehydrogenase family)